MNKDFNKLCTPAKIYFVISVLSCVIALFYGVRVMVVGVKLIMAFIWSALLSWLCKNGFANFSWFLVLLPYVMMVFLYFGVMRSLTNNHTVMMVMPPSAGQ